MILDRREFWKTAALFGLPTLTTMWCGTAVAADGDSEAPPTGEAAMLETFGMVLVAYVVETHTNIGMIRDLAVGKTYSGDQAQGVLKASLTFLEQVTPLVQGLGERTDLGDDDKKAFQDTGALCHSLWEQATALDPFLDSGTDADLAKYDKARAATTKKLAQFLDRS